MTTFFSILGGLGSFLAGIVALIQTLKEHRNSLSYEKNFNISKLIDKNGVPLEDVKELRKYGNLSYGKDPIITAISDEIIRQERSTRFFKFIMLFSFLSYALVFIIFPIVVWIFGRESNIVKLFFLIMPDIFDILSIWVQIGLHVFVVVITIIINKAISNRFPTYMLRNTLTQHLCKLYDRGSISSLGFKQVLYKSNYTVKKINIKKSFYVLYNVFSNSDFNHNELFSFVAPLFGTDQVLSTLVDKIYLEHKQKTRKNLLIISFSIYYFIFFVLVPTVFTFLSTNCLSFFWINLLNLLNGNLYGYFVSLSWYWEILLHIAVATTMISSYDGCYGVCAMDKDDLIKHIKNMYMEDKLGINDTLTPINIEKISIYDVAISYASEDRNYAQQLAQNLSERGIKVFYDEFEQDSLWGKDLAVYLHKIYSISAKYCVIFVSKSYVSKAWTTHELRSALERGVIEKGRDYILPIKIHELELDGIPNTIGYVSIDMGIERITELLYKKIIKNN